ncbi:Kynurenine formamidase [termite gut metagenome]|uniref:Kynurenine formamidase n=1 Tax=termite gut metagenome TaxID=433724 RepID=A0A5J4QQS4_9ZZZZ
MGKIIDLTLPMFDGAPTMPMDPKLSISWHCTLETLGYNLSRVITSTHQGTHIDAARHFFYNGECIDEVALERFIVRAVKVDLTGKKPGEAIEPADLQPYNKWIEQGCSVLLHTGWDKRFPKSSYFLEFPFVTKTLANWFVEKKIGLVGMDTPTPNGEDWKYVHVKMLGADILIVEGLANMEQLPTGEVFTFYSLPLKLQGCDGSPVRAIVMLDL